jgi:rSAM/selenodomain-associated transferase 1
MWQVPERAVPRALAIVAKYPHPGAVKTRLAATLGAVEAAGLYRAFLRDLAARFARTARREGYTLVWARSPGPGDLREVVGSAGRLLVQRGDDFAERLYHVCADLGAASYQRVVVIGSDSPHLPAAWVRRAFEALDRCDAVLGPAQDGGYYLAGLHAAPAPPDLFRGIHMSTPRVFAETLQRAAGLQLNVKLLPVTFDVDEAADLRRLAQALGRPGPLAAASPHTLEALHRLGVRTGEDATTGSRAG